MSMSVLFVALLLVCAVSSSSAEKNASCVEYWRDAQEKTHVIGMDKDRIVIQQGKMIVAASVLEIKGDERTVAYMGRRENWRIVCNAERTSLVITTADKTTVFEREAQPPEILSLKPIPLGKQLPLSKDTVARIQEELEQRFKADQDLRQPPGFAEKMAELEKLKEAGKLDEQEYAKRASRIYEECRKNGAANQELAAKREQVDRDNLKYLLATLNEVGWIDAARFGVPASNAAAFIVQHSGHTPLMLSVLPELEKDSKNSEDLKCIYEMMYYRTRLFSGATPEDLEKLTERFKANMIK